MFKDMEVARDEMGAYSSIQRERQTPLPVDLHVSVLSQSAWPTYLDVPVRIPPEIATAISDFERFYDSKYNGRKLTWKHQLAHCQIRARFPKGNKELVVSSFQAVVLLLFNELPDGGTLSYRQIQEATTLCRSPCLNTLLLNPLFTNTFQRTKSLRGRSSLLHAPNTESSARSLKVGMLMRPTSLLTIQRSPTQKCESRLTRSS